MAEASRLDRLIAYLSPARGAQRLAARRAIEALAYEGARVGRREQGWITGSTSANAEIAGDRITLRNRVRSLLRDNAYAVKGLETLVVNRIGTGILASADGPNKRANERIQARYKTWIDRCDYTGRTDLYGIQALAERCRIESGEAFIRLHALGAPDDPDDVNLRLQVLEPDHLDTTKNERLSDNRREIIEGIEYAGGRAVAYWMYPTHPGDTNPIMPFSIKSVRVPASQVIHYYRAQRPGQLSGASEFAPVIRRLYDLDGYADAELMRKKIAACAVGAVTTPAGLPGASLAPTTINADGNRQEQFQPGMISYLKPGESVSFFDPKPSDGYAEFFEVELHAIASGLRFPYELLTGDFSKVNYTSFRAALVQFKAMVEADQWQLVIPQVCLPIWNAFVKSAEGTMIPAKFTPPRFGLLDPAKEIPAMVEAVQGGLRTWRDTIRREGYEPDEVLAEIKAEREAFEAAGVSVTSIMNPDEPEKPPSAPPSEVPEAAAA